MIFLFIQDSTIFTVLFFCNEFPISRDWGLSEVMKGHWSVRTWTRTSTRPIEVCWWYFFATSRVWRVVIYTCNLRISCKFRYWCPTLCNDMFMLKSLVSCDRCEISWLDEIIQLSSAKCIAHSCLSWSWWWSHQVIVSFCTWRQMSIIKKGSCHIGLRQEFLEKETSYTINCFLPQGSLRNMLV